MRTPTIHLNGTSREELRDKLHQAFHALRVAEEALQATAPHGRDYYPQGPEALREALDEHASRQTRLSTVREELEQLARALAR